MSTCEHGARTRHSAGQGQQDALVPAVAERGPCPGGLDRGVGSREPVFLNRGGARSPVLALASWSVVTRSWPPIELRRWPPSGLALTCCATRRRLICDAREWISTRFALDWATPSSTLRSSIPKSISRRKRKRSLVATRSKPCRPSHGARTKG